MLSKGFVLDCREPGNIASNWPNEGICRSCCKPGHHAGDHWALELPTYDLRICKNCHNQGHFDPDCTNGRLATIAVKTRHLAFKRESEPVCKHLWAFFPAVPKGWCCRRKYHRALSWGTLQCGLSELWPRPSHEQGLHGTPVICHNFSADGHLAYECPSDRFMDGMHRWYWEWWIFVTCQNHLLHPLHSFVGTWSIHYKQNCILSFMFHNFVNIL